MCLAIPGKIIEIVKEGALMRMGRVDFGGVVKEINLAFVPEAKVNDYVIVHVGVAINVLNEEEANETLAYLNEMERLA